MRRVLITVLLSAAALPAQRSNGYLFVAPGGATGGGYTDKTIHLGGGGEWVFLPRVGVGAELGALGPTSDFGDSVMGVFSPNGYVHFGSRGSKLDPFVTGGYTLMFRYGHQNMFNIGGGFHYWFQRNLGLRIEFRDHIYTDTHGYEPAIQFWGIRIGVAF